MRIALILLGLFAPPCAVATAEAISSAPTVVERDLVVHDFRFEDGEAMGALRLHHRTIGEPHRDQAGEIDNAVLLLHSTSSSGAQFLTPNFAGQLFGPGQPLDARRYFVILPDAVGHGRSSKPSDGLHGSFPHYRFADMVEAERRALAEGLGVHRLRLVLGTSMGCMMTFLWAERQPGMVRSAMPIACLPTQISGQNRVWRLAAAEAIRSDPAWQGGNYASPPVQGLRAATGLLAISGGIGPLAMQRDYPTTQAADDFWHKRLVQGLQQTDANDLLYQLEASDGYDAAPGLARLPMPISWVNIGDDFINLPGSQIVTDSAAKIPQGRFYLVPASPDFGSRSCSRFSRDPNNPNMRYPREQNP